MAITYLICAAGEGVRFRKISNKIKKPFLRLNHKTLLERSLSSLKPSPLDQVILIHKFTPQEIDFITREIQPQLNFNLQLLFLDQATRGQAETALKAEAMVKNKSIAIFNVDTFFQSAETWPAIDSDQFDGVVPCFHQKLGSWSYFKTQLINDKKMAIDCAEKKPISEEASVGFYYFKNGPHFFNEVKAALENFQGNEIYVAPFYKKLIIDSKRVLVTNCEVAKPMGTIEQVSEFWNVSESEFTAENT